MNNPIISYEKIRLIQECLYLVKSQFSTKIYGFEEFIQFMARKYESRLKKAETFVRDWVIKTTEDPMCSVGKRRKLDEYNSYDNQSSYCSTP